MAKQSTNATPARGRRPAGRAVFPDTLAQVRALSHPIRLRLLELFAERPRTTMQAAEVLGEAPTRLYHHVAALERSGLVRLRETRPNRGTTEKYFEAVTAAADPGSTAALLADPRGRRELSAAAVLLFDQARNELVRSIASAGDRLPTTNMMAVRAVLRLSPAQGTRLVKELTEVMRRRTGPSAAGKASQHAAERSDRQRYSLTIALLPIDAGPGASRSPAGRTRGRRSAARAT